MTLITKSEELMAVSVRQGVELVAIEAKVLLGYLEGHDYSLMMDDKFHLALHDNQDGENADNGITDAAIVYKVWVQLLQHSERDGLLRAALLVQNMSRYDVEVPSIQHQRVGTLAHGLGIEAEHIHIGLPHDLLSIAVDGVPSSCWTDAELDVGQPAIALSPCLKICAALDLDAHFIASLAITYPVVGERDVVGSPVIVGSAQINAQRGRYDELAVGAPQGIVEQV